MSSTHSCDKALHNIYKIKMMALRVDSDISECKEIYWGKAVFFSLLLWINMNIIYYTFNIKYFNL